jgi:uncharacterized metal-binding protein
MSGNAMNQHAKQYHLIFACSGAADVGAIADAAARQLAKQKIVSFCCTAAIGAGISDILEKARNAQSVSAIDGCDQNCAQRILEQAGMPCATHLHMEEIGMEKGSSPINEKRIAIATTEMSHRLASYGIVREFNASRLS